MASPLNERLEEFLVGAKLLTSEKLREALKIQKEKKEKLADILVRLGYISKENKLQVISAELDVPVIQLSRYKILPEVVALVPKKMAQHYSVIPVSKLTNTLTVAMSDPRDLNAIDDLRRVTRLEIRRVLASEKEIRDAYEQYYAENVSQALKEVMKGIDDEGSLQLDEGHVIGATQSSAQELLKMVDDEPIVKLTNSIMMDAVRKRSSDIFIEPEETAMRVRLRVDGMLQESLIAPRSMHAGVISRVKVMSGLDIAEHRVPQDGRFKLRVADKFVDFRVSVLPTYYGEKIVLRVLDKSGAMLDLDKSGFEPEPLEALKKAAAHPHGMIAVCGPTGSGKTTTLYSTLKLLDNPDKNIVTVEDPIEFQIDGINQVAIRAEVKMTFGAALRSILRQDPDIIMVGEIRDTETADIAVKAALTGHLVLSTLHATTAVGAITRFINMGIEPFLITSSMLLTGSQRLVRKVCPKCKETYEPSRELLKQLGITDRHLAGHHGKILFSRGRGCEACGKKGYSGRAVLLEALPITAAIKNMILKNAQEYELKKMARKEGMKTLRENGISKIIYGTTTPEEVMRVTVRDEEV